jgi:NADPH-dependent 2,4-dienoyl-CoA reductase/sulfur reductase-like enzyme
MSVSEATTAGVRLTDGRFVPTRTVVWTVGVRPEPLVDALGLAVVQGRLRVDEYLGVPGHPEVFACGDVAAVPNRFRILLDWVVDACTRRQAVQLGLVRSPAVPLDTTQPERPRPAGMAHQDR